MDSAVRIASTRTDLPPIPARVISLDGQFVETSNESWFLRSSADGGKLISIHWAKLGAKALLSERARHLVKLFLADKISRKKARTIENDFGMFLRFQEWLSSTRRSPFDWSELTEGIARAFLAHGLEHSSHKGNDFSRLRTFYRWGVARQHADFDPAMLHIFVSITAIGNAKGHHVRFRDPVKGPFSPDELLLISGAVKEQRGADADRAVVMLHLELGHNPNASVRLRNRDLIRYETKAAVVYQLDVPRVKKRTAGRETKRRPISAPLGLLLQTLQQGSPEAQLLHWLSSTSPEADIAESMRRFVKAANLVSPRTQRPLVINARRFRFSIATHMAEEGASLFHIAEVLDHSDTQNVRVYVETASTIADPVARATDAALMPLVRRFQGKIVESFTAAPDDIVPAAAPHLGAVHIDVGGIGTCGRDVSREGMCRMLPPASCYLCPSFMALRDGPHRQMLDSIDGFLRQHAGDSDRRILAQLEDVRVAIQEVVQRLRAPGATNEC